MTYRDAADLADTLAADARDEAASDRAGAWIGDDPRRPGFGAEEPGEPARWPVLWTCRRCDSDQRHGDPFDGCPDCGWVCGG